VIAQDPVLERVAAAAIDPSAVGATAHIARTPPAAAVIVARVGMVVIVAAIMASLATGFVIAVIAAVVTGVVTASAATASATATRWCPRPAA